MNKRAHCYCQARFGEARIAGQWTLLVGLSLVLCIFLTWLGIPAALLLGPLIAGIAITAGGGRLQVPRRVFVYVQGFIGCMIAKMLPLSIMGEGSAHWLLSTLGVLSVIALCG